MSTAEVTREQEFDPARYVFSTPAEPTPIKARTVLPARRENFVVTTADGKRLVITRDDGEEDVIVPVCGGLVRRGCGCGHEYLVSMWIWERYLSHRQQQQHIRMRTAFLLGLCRPTHIREFQPLVRKSSTVSNRSVNHLTTPPNLGRCSHAIQSA